MSGSAKSNNRSDVPEWDLGIAGTPRIRRREIVMAKRPDFNAMWKYLVIPLLAAFLLPSATMADPATHYTGKACTCKCPDGRIVSVPSCYKGNECYAACGIGNPPGSSDSGGASSSSGDSLTDAIMGVFTGNRSLIGFGGWLGQEIGKSIRGNPEEDARRRAEQAEAQRRAAQEEAERRAERESKATRRGRGSGGRTEADRRREGATGRGNQATSFQ